jgi:hypothetical protein
VDVVEWLLAKQGDSWCTWLDLPLEPIASDGPPSSEAVFLGQALPLDVHVDEATPCGEEEAQATFELHLHGVDDSATQPLEVNWQFHLRRITLHGSPAFQGSPVPLTPAFSPSSSRPDAAHGRRWRHVSRTDGYATAWIFPCESLRAHR